MEPHGWFDGRFDPDELANRRMEMIETKSYGNIAARMVPRPTLA